MLCCAVWEPNADTPRNCITMIAFDATFFLRLRDDCKGAMDAWRRIREGERGVISAPALIELISRAEPEKDALRLAELMQRTLAVLPVTQETVAEAAALRRAFDLPVTRSMDLACAVLSGAEEFYTGDPDYRRVYVKPLKIEIVE